jgi:hypothetical protein
MCFHEGGAMTSQKPPMPGEKVFNEEDEIDIQNIRAELDRKREEELKEKSRGIHWMKCPKCGSDLEEINYQDVMVDRCNNCRGIWLDHGEFGLLVRRHLGECKIFFTKIFGF